MNDLLKSARELLAQKEKNKSPMRERNELASMIRLLERGHDDIRVVEKEILIRSTYKCSYFPELGVTYFRDDSLIYRDPPEYIYKGELVVVKREVHSYQGWSNNMAASATHYYIQKGA